MRSTAVVSSKGQIVIPSKLRKRYGLREGTRVVFQEEGGRLTLAPSNWDELLALAGSLSGLGLEEDLDRERRAERERENRR